MSDVLDERSPVVESSRADSRLAVALACVVGFGLTLIGVLLPWAEFVGEETVSYNGLSDDGGAWYGRLVALCALGSILMTLAAWLSKSGRIPRPGGLTDIWYTDLNVALGAAAVAVSLAFIWLPHLELGMLLSNPFGPNLAVLGGLTTCVASFAWSRNRGGRAMPDVSRDGLAGVAWAYVVVAGLALFLLYRPWLTADLGTGDGDSSVAFEAMDDPGPAATNGWVGVLIVALWLLAAGLSFDSRRVVGMGGHVEPTANVFAMCASLAGIGLSAGWMLTVGDLDPDLLLESGSGTTLFLVLAIASLLIPLYALRGRAAAEADSPG